MNRTHSMDELAQSPPSAKFNKPSSIPVDLVHATFFTDIVTIAFL